jgi:hypothetical protein
VYAQKWIFSSIRGPGDTQGLAGPRWIIQQAIKANQEQATIIALERPGRHPLSVSDEFPGHQGHSLGQSGGHARRYYGGRNQHNLHAPPQEPYSIYTFTTSIPITHPSDLILHINPLPRSTSSSLKIFVLDSNHNFNKQPWFLVQYIRKATFPSETLEVRVASSTQAIRT